MYKMNNNNEVDVSFIQTVLRKHEKDDSIVVEDIRIEQACGKGENFMSVVLRVHVKGYRNTNSNYSEFNLPLIVKRPYQSDLLNGVYHFDDLFRNEEIAYKQIIPAMRKHFNNTIPTAVCLHADKSWMILQDLRALGFVMKPNQVCMTVAQCSAVMRELAVLHSASIILKVNEPKQVEMYANQIKDTFHSDNIAIADMIDNTFGITLKLFHKLEHQTDEIKHAINILKTHCSKRKIFNKVCKLLKTECDKNVFNHGDCWRNNILFKEQAKNDVDIKLIDLQIMRYTSVAADLCYFLFINLMPEDRNANKEYLLNVYLNMIHVNLADHGIDAEELGYTRDWLEVEFNKFSVFGFMCSLWIAPVFYCDKSALPDMDNLKPEQMDPEFNEKYILDNMTPGLRSRINAIVLDFAKNIDLA